jgi:hypothetical protein
MTRTRIPDAILTAAHDRAKARQAHDWPEADRLRAVIEAAGWRIVDRGTDFSLTPAHPPDVVEGQTVRYGSSASVPSRLDEPSRGVATVVLVATDHPEDVARAVASIATHAPVGTSVVIVADDPSAAQADALATLGADAADVIRTSQRLGHAAAINIGIRRAGGPVVVLLDTSVELTGDAITPLVAALDDPDVAVAGGWGLTSRDLRHFEEAGPGDVDAIEAYAMAFRRADAAVRGPLDERFRFYRNLDIWWSLVLRDEGNGRPPRRAVRLADLPLVRHEHRGWTSLSDEDRDRQSKRNFYRIIDRFGARRDLLVDAAGPVTGD